MTQFASEMFAGTAGTELATYSANWAKLVGATQRDIIISDVARGRFGATAGGAGYFHSAVPASADYSVSADLVVVSNQTGSQVNALARCSTSAVTFYMFGFAVGTGWRLFKCIANSFTQLGSTVADTLTVGNTYRVEVRCNGTSISGYVDGALKIGPITDSDITAAGQPGLRLFGSSAGGDSVGLHADNWSADTLGGATAKPHHYYALMRQQAA